MHIEVYKFVELISKFYPNKDDLKILEIGSYDINGSIRNLFKGSHYVGVDICNGPGVDVVDFGHMVKYPDESFDITISCECFEHNPYWVETFINMHRMTKKNGVVIVTSASRGRLEHGTFRTNPDESPGTKSVGIDYYRNLNKKDFDKNLTLSIFFSFCKFHYASKPRDLYFIGWKTTPNHLKLELYNFDSEIKKLNYLNQPSFSFKSILIYIYKMPVIVAMYSLNDKHFQNFNFAYVKFTYLPKKIIKFIFNIHN